MKFKIVSFYSISFVGRVFFTHFYQALLRKRPPACIFQTVIFCDIILSMRWGWRGIPIPIWMQRVFASTTPRAVSEWGSMGFPFCGKDDLYLLAHLCHAEQKPYLKGGKIIQKSVVCVSKIKLLHFFHPFASHFPGNSTTPQAAVCPWVTDVCDPAAGCHFRGSL